MKKIHVLIPAIATISFMPLVGLVGCGNDEPEPEPTPPEPETGLCFESDNGDKSSKIKYEVHGNINNLSNAELLDIEYKFNNDEWKDWTWGIDEKKGYGVSQQLEIKPSDKLYVRNTTSKFSRSEQDYVNFKVDAHYKIKASGNVNSLINYSDTLSDFCFCKLFWACRGLTQAPKLTSTTLSKYCYADMFYLCVALQKMPELPATQLNEYCYSCMFMGCSGLNVTSELPAETTSAKCYYHMFANCSSLVKPPHIKAIDFNDGCCWSMFNGCKSLKIKYGNEGDGNIFVVTGQDSGPFGDMFTNVNDDSEVKGNPGENKICCWYE